MIYHLKDLKERRCMNMSRPYSVAQRPSCPLMNGRCHCLELWKAVFLGWQEQERRVLEVYHDTLYRTFENKFVARSQRQHHDLELLRELLAEVIARRGKLFGHRDLAQRDQECQKNRSGTLNWSRKIQVSPDFFLGLLRPSASSRRLELSTAV